MTTLILRSHPESTQHYLNWSEIAESTIEERVEEEMKRKRETDPTAVLKAIKEQDKIAEALGRKPSKEWSSVKVIWYWREHRYSSSTRR